MGTTFNMGEDLPASTASGPFSPPAAAIALLAPGTSIGGRYRVDDVIGFGGYGVVYLAFDKELTRHVALKVLRPERASAEGLARFRREVAIAREISSPRLVRVFDIGSSENAIYLTMEHVEGESLKERLRRGPLSIDEAIATSVAILEGLEPLHAAGVIHRDVKPGNVLLGADGEVKLGDFGLARSGLDESSLTHSGTLLGTSEYVAPEQALGKELDLRSDLYSTGIVMYEMLTGQPPFPAESALGVLLARLKAPAPDPRKVRREIPSWLARIVLRLLERKPGDRYPNATAVLRDLVRRRARYRVRGPALILGGVLVVLVLAGFVAESARDAQEFSHLIVRPEGGVTAVARDGRPLWSLPNAQPPGTFALTNDAPVCDLQAPVGPAVMLRWTAASGVTTYDFYRNGSITSAVGLTGTTFYCSVGVAAGQTYTFFIRAKNANGTRDSNTITVAIPSTVCPG